MFDFCNCENTIFSGVFPRSDLKKDLQLLEPWNLAWTLLNLDMRANILIGPAWSPSALTRDVGGDLGGPELPYYDLQRGAVVEAVALLLEKGKARGQNNHLYSQEKQML